MANPKPDTSGLKPWKPGQSGNPSGMPKWRKEVLRVWGDGQPYLQTISELAKGNIVIGSDPREGHEDVEVVIRPNANIVLAAFRELRDTAVGRPLQQVISAHISTPQGQDLSVFTERLNDRERKELSRMMRKLVAAPKAVKDEDEQAEALAQARDAIIDVSGSESAE